MSRTVFAPRIDDWGTAIRFRVLGANGRREDLSLMTTLQVVIRKPDATTITETATVDPGDDTQAYYTVQAGDFDQAGDYELEVHYGNAGGAWTTEPFRFEVVARV